MKTFVLTVSRVFPSNHPKKGEQTFFEDKIMKRYSDSYNFLGWQKIHTIRSNYDLWAKRIEQVQKGEAIISLRYWSGKPYNTKQIEFCQLDKDSGIGVQAIVFPDNSLFNSTICGPDFPKTTWYKGANISELAKNDGLSVEDFREWFKSYDLSKPMAIIHFSSFRY